MTTIRARPTNWLFISSFEEGERTRVGEVHVVGNAQVKTANLPELSIQPGQPYSEQDLASDRERILSYYFDHGFPNATLELYHRSLQRSEPD